MSTNEDIAQNDAEFGILDAPQASDRTAWYARGYAVGKPYTQAGVTVQDDVLISEHDVDGALAELERRLLAAVDDVRALRREVAARAVSDKGS